MAPRTQSTVVRRSVALPISLVEDSRRCAPEDLRNNFNRLVAVALTEYVERREALAFEQSMAQMAHDPEIHAACAEITDEFKATEADGLGVPR